MATLHKYFRVTIPAAVDTAVVGEGFIDDRNIASFDATPLATNDALALDKTIANLRWAEIVKMMNEIACTSVESIDKTGGDQNTVATEIAFTVGFTRDGFLSMIDRVTDITSNTVYGPLAASLASTGKTLTAATEIQVIERAVASALSQPTFTDQANVVKVSTVTQDAFEDVTITQFGTGATQALRMASIEAIAGLTVVLLDV